jgi:uncharacterized protein
VSELGRQTTDDRRQGEGLTARLSALGAACRARGVRAGTGELLGAHRALAAIDPTSREEAFLALRAVLCSRREDRAAFAAAFEEVFGDGELRAWDAPPPALDDAARLVLPRTAVPAAASGAAPPEDGDLVPAAWSEIEILREKDFASYSHAERVLSRALLARLARRGPVRPSRRLRAARHRGARPDLRRTVRASMRHGGEPLERRWRAPSTRPRPLVLVADVSGSMEPYARMALQYLHAAVAARARVEAFVFGTRLTRVTRELAGRDHDRALERAAAAVSDWSGGTRIGDALATLNRVHGRRLGRGAVVVVLSDGWDRGDPELLAAEMARLGRCAHRLVWLNPLKASEGYAPLARGMAAALPHVDEFLAGNTLRSLEELAELLESSEKAESRKQKAGGVAR